MNYFVYILHGYVPATKNRLPVKLISYVAFQNKYIANKEARTILHVSDTVKVSKLFNRWVKQGLLTKIVPRTGAKRNVRYRLPMADEKISFTIDKGK